MAPGSSARLSSGRVQQPLAPVIQDQRHSAAAYPEHVLGEAHFVGQLNIRQVNANMTGVVHQPLTVHHPLVRVRHVPTLPARQSRTEESRSGHLSAAGAAK